MKTIAFLLCVPLLAAGTFAQCGPGVSPYSEDFETATVGVPGTYPTGWTDGSGIQRWNVHSGGTATAATGPLGDAVGGTNYIYFETTGVAPADDALIVTPCYDTTGVTTPTLEFWHHMFGDTMGSLEVEMEDGQGGWTQIWSSSGSLGTIWEFASIPVTLPGGATTTSFRFRGIAGSDETGDMALDAVEFGNGSTPAPEWQSNSAVATLDVNGLTYSGAGPAVTTTPVNVSVNLNVSSSVAGNFGDLAISSVALAARSAGGAVYPSGNVVNLDVSQSIISFNDGQPGLNLQPTNNVVLPIQSASITTRSAQLTMVDPVSPDGFVMSQGVQLEVLGGSQVVLSDDDSALMSLGFTFNFYGTGYSDVYVNSNGHVTFGSGNSGFATTGSGLNGNSFPSIACYSTDLDPSTGGFVTFDTDNATLFQVGFAQVPVCCGTPFPHSTFDMTAVEGTSVTFSYGQMDDPYDIVVGLAPGSNLGTPLPLDLSASSPTTFANPGTDAPYEEWAYGGANFDLDNTNLVFTMDASGNPLGVQ